MHTPIAYPLTIYYDASCPLCRTEMHSLKQADTAHQLILVDCSPVEMQVPDSCPVTREALMDRIHAQDAEGRWISGVEVFAAAYTVTGFSKLGKFWSSPTLRPFLQRAYPWVAKHRFWLSKTPLPWLMQQLLAKKSSKRR